MDGGGGERLMERTVLLVTDDPSLLGSRYPRRGGYGGQAFVMELGTSDRTGEAGVAAVVVDGGAVGDVGAALGGEGPRLVSLTSYDVARRSSGGLPDRLDAHGDWLPYMPARRAADVSAAADLIASGSIGVPWSCELTSHVGPPPDGAAWEADAPFARSLAEAVLFGADAAERLLGRCLGASAWSSRLAAGGRARILTGDTTDGVRVTQTVLSRELAEGPALSAVIRGDRGRVLLRQAFAPGAVTVWDAVRREFRSPAVRRPKMNVQSPDTAPGGVETAEVMTDLLTPGSVDNHVERLRFERLAEQALAAAMAP